MDGLYAKSDLVREWVESRRPPARVSEPTPPRESVGVPEGTPPSYMSVILKNRELKLANRRLQQALRHAGAALLLSQEEEDKNYEQGEVPQVGQDPTGA